MAKQPYIQFYLGDYIKDTRVLPLNVKGGWVDLILAMWDNDPKGEIIGSIDDFARIMNCSKDEANLVIQTLKQKKIFDYQDGNDGIMRIVSRKQKKMQKLAETRKKVGEKGGNPILLNQKVNQQENQKDKLNTEYEYKYETTNLNNGIGIQGEGWTDQQGRTWHQVKQKWFDDFRWREKVQSDNGITSVELDKKILVFVADLELKDDYKDVPALKKHFINWHNKHKNGTKSTTSTVGKTIEFDRP